MPFLALFLAFLISLLLVPPVRSLSLRFGLVSLPRQDRWHRNPTPILGGVSMFAAFTAALLITAYITRSLGQLRWSLLGSAALIFALGLLDDFKRLSPPAKLVGQILAAAIVIFFGRVIAFFPWGFANVILTFFWLVGITNAINLLDNMDGLAGGIALIAAGFLSYFLWRSGNQPLLLVSLSLAGCILGFLVFNFPPARIFMGDSGSMFLGFTLAALAVVYRPQASDVFSVMGVPILLFLLPILDTTLVTITRLLRGQSPVKGGVDHTSHRLIAFGLNERQAVLVLYLVGILSGIASYLLESLNYGLSLLIVPLLLIFLALITAYLGGLKVVTKSAPAPRNITRLMAELTYKRRFFEMILDFLLIGASYYLAFFVQADFKLDTGQITSFIKTTPIALSAAYLAFLIFGVYRGVWRYVGVEDLILYMQASLGAAFLTALTMRLFSSGVPIPLTTYLLFAVFLFLGLAGSRSSFGILDRLSQRQQSRTSVANVLIYGAEDAGEIALSWIMRNPDMKYRPVGFLDDDPYKWGRRIHGISVLGGVDQLEKILVNKRVDGVILAEPGLQRNGALESVREACLKKGIWIKTLRLDFESLE
jgi:UDP-GlcNAc:undecaprenyl-phosphate/decaprenyl-phosphate GlcNAc-1-phosphate transferase